MDAAVGLVDGLGLDGDRCVRVIPRQFHLPISRPIKRTLVLPFGFQWSKFSHTQAKWNTNGFLCSSCRCGKIVMTVS